MKKSSSLPFRLFTVVGARPQFIKAAALSRCFRKYYHGVIEESIVHTGQHYDAGMSDVFFRSLKFLLRYSISNLVPAVMVSKQHECLKVWSVFLFMKNQMQCSFMVIPIQLFQGHWQHPNLESRSYMWKQDYAVLIRLCRKKSTGF